MDESLSSVAVVHDAVVEGRDAVWMPNAQCRDKGERLNKHSKFEDEIHSSNAS